MKKIQIVILAAGKSSRFKSSKHKALHDLLGKTIIERISESLINIKLKDYEFALHFVLGHQKELLINELKNKNIKFSFSEQIEQLGTAHALQTALKDIPNCDGLLVLCVDTPLIKTKSLENLILETINSNAELAVLTTTLENSFGYGRIIKDSNNNLKAIIEEKDANTLEKQIQEINSGIYFFNFKTNKLLDKLNKIKNENIQKEYYLTDIVKIFNQDNLKVITHKIIDSNEILGINSKKELSLCIKILSQNRIQELENEGVIFLSPESCLVSPETQIGQDTIVYQNNTFIGKNKIANNCEILINNFIFDSEIGNNCKISSSYVSQSKIANNCSIGPFANIRINTFLEEGVHIGDFVETKNVKIGKDSKASHLSYLGDAEIGSQVNIGAGTITANFNAISGEKHKTIINDGVKVGSNSVFVAPVKVAKDCMIAAGTVVDENVEQEASLIISRNKQKIKENWIKK